MHSCYYRPQACSSPYRTPFLHPGFQNGSEISEKRSFFVEKSDKESKYFLPVLSKPSKSFLFLYAFFDVFSCFLQQFRAIWMGFLLKVQNGQIQIAFIMGFLSTF